MDRLITTFKEALIIIEEFLEALRASIKEFVEMLFTCNPKRKTFPRGRPQFIKCIGRAMAGHTSRTRTRIRNSC